MFCTPHPQGLFSYHIILSKTLKKLMMLKACYIPLHYPYYHTSEGYYIPTAVPVFRITMKECCDKNEKIISLNNGKSNNNLTKHLKISGKSLKKILTRLATINNLHVHLNPDLNVNTLSEGLTRE